MNKTAITNKFGLIALVIIFIIIYSYFSTNKLTNNILQTQNYTENKATIGSLGGYHLLDDISFKDESSYFRISIHTSLNRNTTLDETIITPYAIATQNIGDNKQYQIKVSLSDTRTFDLSYDPALEIFKKNNIVVNSWPITEINTQNPHDDSTIDVLIGLNKKVKFKVSKNNTGTIFIDILK